uniref:Uncharacterized protein n=1 Tax=Anguilla anguilla TaxID=7936 RepID=A0A0E9Q2R4_ANGAN
MLPFLRVSSVQRSRMSSGLGRGGIAGRSSFCSVTDWGTPGLGAMFSLLLLRSSRGGCLGLSLEARCPRC